MSDWWKRLAEDIGEAAGTLLRHYANTIQSQPGNYPPPAGSNPNAPPPGQPIFTPELEELIRQLGQIQIEFVFENGRIYCRIWPDTAPRHYANNQQRQAPPRPNAQRTIQKRRGALKTLGLTDDATPEEIRAAYKKLAFQLHPDRNPRGAERMTRVNLAYAYLKQEWATK
jgi:hypothetical protein